MSWTCAYDKPKTTAPPKWMIIAFKRTERIVLKESPMQGRPSSSYSVILWKKKTNKIIILLMGLENTSKDVPNMLDHGSLGPALQSYPGPPSFLGQHTSSQVTWAPRGSLVESSSPFQKKGLKVCCHSLLLEGEETSRTFYGSGKSRKLVVVLMKTIGTIRTKVKLSQVISDSIENMRIIGGLSTVVFWYKRWLFCSHAWIFGLILEFGCFGLQMCTCWLLCFAGTYPHVVAFNRSSCCLVGSLVI